MAKSIGTSEIPWSVSATRIKSENAFYSKERDSYISDSFNIWSVHLVSDRSREGKPRERHSLEFHRIFIRNFQTQYLKGLDADFYWSLHSPLARRLYRLIDQQRRGQLTFHVEDRCVKGSEFEVQAAHLYREYRRYWCEENGHRPQSSTRLSDDWRRLGFERRTKSGTVYRGLHVHD